MNLTLWIVAGVLAALFLASGVVKLARTRAQLAASGMGFADDFSTASVKAIGAAEILAAAGLVLPAALSVAPVLVPLAAAGLALLMAGAFIVHLRRRETQGLGVTALLFVLAVVVAWARFGTYSFNA